MPIVKKAFTREVRTEEPVSLLHDGYAHFIESSADPVVNAVLEKRKWREQRRSRSGETGVASPEGTEKS